MWIWILILIAIILVLTMVVTTKYHLRPKDGRGEHIRDFIKAHEHLQENYDEIMNEIKKAIT